MERCNGWLRRATAGLLLASLVPAGSLGCFGRFQLLRNVYKFNLDATPDPWMRWFVFLVLNVIPVYGLATTIDLLLANSIEFWTGENPIQPTPGTRSAVAPDGSLVSLTPLAVDVVQVSVRSPAGELQQFVVTREGETLAARDADGRLLARVGERDGRPALLERSGPAS